MVGGFLMNNPNNENKAAFASTDNSQYNLKVNYEPKSLSDVIRKRRLKLTDTKLGDQFNEETGLGRVGKDEQRNL